MEHKPLAELQTIADVHFPQTEAPMTREQRLERWIVLLQADPDRKLRSLHEIEHLSAACRRECHAQNSPLTVAYEDAILRSAGLRSDRVGDCTDFFELDDKQMHHAFCSCHVGARFTGREAAERLRHVAQRDAFGRNPPSILWPTIRRIFGADRRGAL
jgi:hypothetical protein